MGLKGISWFEQNVEKVAVGVFGVALLGVVAVQFVGKGNQVELTAGREKRAYPFDEVWGAVRDTASATHSRITSAEPDQDVMNFQAGPGVLESFNASLRGSVAPQPTLAGPLDASVLDRLPIDMGGEGRGVAAEIFAPLKAPPAAKPTAATYLATLHPQEVLGNPDLLKVVAGDLKLDDPAKGADIAAQVSALLPRLDRAGISVETMYDGTALEQALLADPDGDGPQAALPRHWWDSGRVQILGVELERQELKADGEWTEAAAVARMPGRLDLLESIAQMEAGEGIRYSDVLQAATRSNREVLRPTYYAIMLGDEWIPPTEVAEDIATIPEGGDKAARHRSNLASVTDEMVRVQEQKRKLQEEPGVVPPGRGQPPPPPAGGGRGRPGGGPGREQAPQRDPKQEAILRLDNRLRSLAEKRQRIIDQATREGIVLEEERRAPGAPAADLPVVDEAEPALLTNPAVRVWSHDISVERGKTYRYRVSLVLNNPMYGKSAALDPKQEELAENPLVRTPPSDWSDPVHVEPETYYFITGASPEDAFASSARASAEVYYFSMGFWRKGQVNLEPGDTITAEVRVPDPAKVMAMLDLNQGMPEAPQPPPGRGIPPGVRQPIGPGQLPPGQNAEPGVIDPATMLVPRTVTEDAMLLDVATTTVVSEQGIARTKTENQAFLLGDDGKIQVRTPDGDRTTVAYAKLRRSAERGEEALRPRTKLDPANLLPGVLPGNDPINPKVPGGGGGGG